jgi:hypothetical protein
MRRIARGVLLALLLIVVVAVPSFASYYAYITAEEEDGNAYTNLPVMVTRNITQLVDYDIITSSGLDTRVLTGDGVPLEHMLADDRVLFVTDLEADEEKTLIFYTGATSLSQFPIIVGYNGSITTPDDAQLEQLYVMEVLASGYFDASDGTDKNILYKEDAFRAYISNDDELTVAALEAGDVEQWALTDNTFTSGEHSIYLMANGLVAYLYVDDFEIAKDTVNLFDAETQTLDGSGYAAKPSLDKTFYAAGLFWAFYHDGPSDDYIRWKTSSDGASWSGEQTVAIYNSADNIQGNGGFSVFFDGTYCHFAYADYDSGSENFRYRRGTPENDGSITWSAVWQTASGGAYTYAKDVKVAADSSHYPMIGYTCYNVGNNFGKIVKSSANDGTWSTAAGYPLEYNLYQVYTLTCNPYGDNKGYALARLENDDDVLYGKYYNGSTWAGTWQTIVPDADGIIYPSATDAVMDNDYNAHIAWTEYHGTYYTVHLRIRYSDGTLSNIIDVAGESGDPSRYISMAYNPDSGVVYMFYGRNGYIRARSIYGTEISSEYTLFAHDEGYGLGCTPYSAHIGIVADEPSGSYVHGTVDLTAYTWNDNSNNWTWMQNNVMPYADTFVMAIDGTTHLEYKPTTIIQDATLPDISGASDNDGEISWGTNPGVTTEIGMFSSDSDAPSSGGNMTGTPGTDPLDMMGPTGQPGWTAGLPTLPGNPLYPLVNTFATLTSIPLGIMWILGATLLLLIAMLLAYRYLPHLIMTALVGGGVAAFWVHMGIYPFWVIFIFAVAAIGIIISERMPSIG